MVQEALREAPFAMRQLAEDAGLAHQTLRAWASGLRTPEPESVRKLASALRRRSGRLAELADWLEREAGR